jgi:ERCC4-type nuclease
VCANGGESDLVSTIAPTKATSPPLTPLTVPFSVAIDTREQYPYTFTGLVADARHRRRPLAVPTVRAGLPAGDYSIVGCETAVAIERKSLADLFMTIGQGRGRFARELERLCDPSYTFAAVVVEGEWSVAVNSPPRHSRFPAKNVFRTVVSWQQRYRPVHWWWCPGRAFAEITTFRILERWWRGKTSPDQ